MNLLKSIKSSINRKIVKSTYKPINIPVEGLFANLFFPLKLTEVNEQPFLLENSQVPGLYEQTFNMLFISNNKKIVHKPEQASNFNLTLTNILKYGNIERAQA